VADDFPDAAVLHQGLNCCSGVDAPLFSYRAHLKGLVYRHLAAAHLNDLKPSAGARADFAALAARGHKRVEVSEPWAIGGLSAVSRARPIRRGLLRGAQRSPLMQAYQSVARPFMNDIHE